MAIRLPAVSVLALVAAILMLALSTPGVDATAGVSPSVTPTSVEVMEDGGTATFSVKLDGDPDYSDNSVTVSRVTVDGVNIPYAQWGNLPVTIDPSPRSMALVYTPGESGNWDTPQTITITGKPDTIKGDRTIKLRLRFTSIGNTRGSVDITITIKDDDAWKESVAVTGEDDSARFSWDELEGATGYQVLWKKATALRYNASTRSHTTDADARGYARHKLEVGIGYDFKVVAKKNSVDLASQELEHFTHGYMDAYADPAEGDAQTLDVEWMYVIGATGYAVTWDVASSGCHELSDSPVLSGLKDITDSNTTETQITGLAPDTDYYVRVTAYTANGSAASPDGLSWTDCATPTNTEITSVTVDPVSGSQTELDVAWAVGTAVNAFPINGFVVQWKTGSGDYNDTDKVTVAKTARSRKITGLTAGTTYTVRVTARVLMFGSTWDGDSAEQAGATNATPRTLIANTGQTTENSHFALNTYDVAQAFTTGSSSSGYTVTGVGVKFETVIQATGPYDVGIYTDSSGAPGTLVGSLTPPASLTIGTGAVNTWTTTGIDLSANTDYFVLIDSSSDHLNYVAQTTSDDEDAGGASGWSIADDSLVRSRGAATGGWLPPVSVSAQIEITGFEKPDSSGSVGGTSEAEAAPSPAFTVYYDPDHSPASTNRYREGTKLLRDAGLPYAIRIVSGTSEVDQLAGVTNSVLPRFFLGDPTEEGWTSQIKVNNGGLRWLQKKLAGLGL